MSKKKRTYTGRDALLVRLINGATKSGAHKDHKKEEDKYACRTDDLPDYCSLCYEELDNSAVGDICNNCFETHEE